MSDSMGTNVRMYLDSPLHIEEIPSKSLPASSRWRTDPEWELHGGLCSYSHNPYYSVKLQDQSRYAFTAVRYLAQRSLRWENLTIAFHDTASVIRLIMP